MRHPASNGAVLPSIGLPAWATVALDGALGSGVLRFDTLDGMDADALTDMARQISRHSLDGFDAASAVARLTGPVAA